MVVLVESTLGDWESLLLRLWSLASKQQIEYLAREMNPKAVVASG